MNFRINEQRYRILRSGHSDKGPVVYWMSREQRIEDNWALIFAQDKANQEDKYLIIVFCLVDRFLDATLRQYDFMIQGLKETVANSLNYNIPFFLILGDPGQSIPKFVEEYEASFLVTDFDPLRIKREWKEKAIARINIPTYEVDAHNIVPCWHVSKKQEFAARTFRPKIEKQLPDFLEPFPGLISQSPRYLKDYQGPDWPGLEKKLQVDASIKPVSWLVPGTSAGLERLAVFLDQTITAYASKSNDPNAKRLSNLSPYLHFGQIAPQRVALETMKTSKDLDEHKRAFWEELVVRRELSDNFCFYNSSYDSFEGLPNWAKQTLNKHRQIPRDFIYKYKDFELAKTNDPLWNAAQIEMTGSGKLHGYLRMYWAKKILEWTESPEQAIEWAIKLNDTYEIDGRDPNGYTGILWSIGGLHDRAFKERPIFGKVRYMSYKGCQRKFDVKAYINRNLG